MTQLAEIVRRIEHIKYEKERHKNFEKCRREKIAYLELYIDNDNSINYQDLDVNQEDDEIGMAKLQHGPPYTCQMLKLNEKQKLPNSKYNIDIIKADKIFDVLLKEKQIPLVMIIKCLLSNKEKEKDIANFIIFLDIGLTVVYVSET